MSLDVVNSPSHYTQGEIECIDAIESATVNKVGILAVYTGNIIKYIWRCEEKNGLEDLKKARWYLNRMIAKEEKKLEALDNRIKEDAKTIDTHWSKL